MRSCGRFRARNRATCTHHCRPVPSSRSVASFSSSNQVPVTEVERDGLLDNKHLTTQAKENAEALHQRLGDQSPKPSSLAGAAQCQTASSRLAAASTQPEHHNDGPSAGKLSQFQDLGCFIAAAASGVFGNTISSKTSSSSQRNTAQLHSSQLVADNELAETHSAIVPMQKQPTADALDPTHSIKIASPPSSEKQVQIAAVRQTVPPIPNDEITATAASTPITPTTEEALQHRSTMLETKVSDQDSKAAGNAGNPSLLDSIATGLSESILPSVVTSGTAASSTAALAGSVVAADLSAGAHHLHVSGAVQHKAAESVLEASVSHADPPQPFYTPPPRTLSQRQRRGGKAVPSLVVSVSSEEAFAREVEQETDRPVVLYISSQVVIHSGDAEEPEIHWKNDPVLLQMKRTAKQLVSVIDQCAREVQHVKFVHMQADSPEMRKLCKELEVPKLPSLQFWQKGALMFETCGVNNIQKGLSEGLLYYADTAARGSHVSPLVPDLHSAKDVKTFVSSHADQSLTVVGYFMTSLNACVHVFPAMYALAKAHPQLSLARVLGDESDEMWQYCVHIGLVQAPTFVFYRMGEEVGRFVGGNKADLIGQVLRYLVPSEHTQLPHLVESAQTVKLTSMGSTAPTLAGSA